MPFQKSHTPWWIVKGVEPPYKKYAKEILAKKKQHYADGTIKPWNKGLTKETDERVKQAALAISMNKEHSKNISLGKKGISCVKLKGRKRPKEVIDKVLATKKIRFAEGKYIPARYWLGKRLTFIPYMYGKTHTEEARAKLREWRSHQVIPKKDTSIEIKLQDFLATENVSFEKHKPITGQPDIFISPNICIFADGCYWHGCNKCNLEKARHPDDSKITDKLQNSGYKVLRFWEHDIKNNFENVCSKILEEIPC